MRNRYEIRGDIVVITLTRRGGKEPLETKVSRRRLPKLLALDVRWYAMWHSDNRRLLVVAQVIDGRRKRYIQLHRFVTDCADYEFVIHRNEDTLDNTDENLLVTQYNGSGVTSQHNPGQPGVYYDDVMSKWYIVVEVRRGKTRRVERWYDSITEAEADFKLATEYCKKYTYY